MHRAAVLLLFFALSGCISAPQGANEDRRDGLGGEVAEAGRPATSTETGGVPDAACDPAAGDWSGNAPFLPAFEVGLEAAARTLAEAVHRPLDDEGQTLEDGRRTWRTADGGRLWAQETEGLASFQLRTETWLEPERDVARLLSAVDAPGREAWRDVQGPAGVAIRLEHAGDLFEPMWHVHPEGFQVTALPDLTGAVPAIDRAEAQALAEAYLVCIGQGRFEAQPVAGAAWGIAHDSLVHRVRVGPEEEVHPCCLSMWVEVDAVTGAIHRTR